MGTGKIVQLRGFSGKGLFRNFDLLLQPGDDDKSIQRGTHSGEHLRAIATRSELARLNGRCKPWVKGVVGGRPIAVLTHDNT